MFIFLCSEFSHFRLFGIKHISFPSDFAPYGSLISELHLSELDAYLLNARLGVNVYIAWSTKYIISSFKCLGFQGSRWGLYVILRNGQLILIGQQNCSHWVQEPCVPAGDLFSWRSLSNSISWTRLKNTHHIIL